MTGALLGSIPIPLINFFFVEYHVARASPPPPSRDRAEARASGAFPRRPRQQELPLPDLPAQNRLDRLKGVVEAK
jgi:hypothetical protein